MTISTITLAKTMAKTLYDSAVREKAATKVWDWEQVWDVMSIGDNEGNAKKFLYYSSLPMAEQRGQLQPYPVYDFEELGDVTLTTVKFMLAARISREALKDSIHIKNLASELATMQGESHAQTIAQFAARAFNLLTDTAQDTWETGVAVCGNHTLKDLGATTYSNNYTATALTHDNVWADINTYRWGFRTHNNFRQYDSINVIMASPDKEASWRKILENSVEPDTMDRNDNFVGKMGLKMIYNPFLTVNTNRIYFGKKAKERFKFAWREKMQTDQVEDKGNQGAIYLSWCRAGFKILDYLGVARNAGL